jgi:glycosyltransferase involved in cell wall biosynthesis
VTAPKTMAIDASVMARTRSGVAVYAANILRYLETDGLRCILFSDLPLAADLTYGHEQQVVPLPFTSQTCGRNLMAPLWLHGLLPRALDKWRPSLLWAPNFYLPWSYQRDTVATIHDLIPRQYRMHDHPYLWRKYFLLMLERTASNASHLIVGSQYVADSLRQLYGTPASRISVTPHGVADEYRTPPGPEAAGALRDALAVQGHYILCLGGFLERKNVITLIRAYSQLPRDLQQQYQLLVAGPSGCEERKIRDTVRVENLEDRVRFLGRVPQRLLPDLYKLATVFAFPSLAEGFGLPIVEAMAAGTPVLTSNTTSIPEVAGDAAILLPPTDVEAWARELQRVLTDEATHADLRQRGYERAKRFSWPESARQHAEIFRRFV